MESTADRIDVLHVDDEPSFTEMAATFLEREDDRLRVTTVSGTAAGLEHLEAEPVDCVISDYDMPGRNGLEFLETVRDRYGELPFILFTGKGSEEIASEAVTAGVTDYRQKEAGTDQYAVLARRVVNAVERYQSRQALTESEARLSLFFEKSPLGVIEWNESFEIVRMNRTAEEILGFDEATLKGESWEAIVPPGDREQVSHVVGDLLDAETGNQSINENITENGRTIVCEWHNRAITDDDGEVVAILSQFQDVTDRRERQQELSRERDRFKTLFEHLPVATVDARLIDGEPIVRQVNPAFEETFGYDADDIIGENFDDYIIPPGESETNVNDTVVKEGSTAGYLRRQTADGVREFYGEMALIKESDGPQEGYAIYLDVTNQREAQRRFQLLFENSPVMIDIHDPEGTILEANRRLCETTGYDSEELVGMKVWDLDAEAAPKNLKDMWARMGTDDIHRLETRYERADGSTFPVEVNVVRLSLEGSDRFFVISRDVTEREERERELQEQNERLEEFAALITHDLRNPLSVAKGRLGLVSADADDADHLEHVSESLERIEDIIDDLTLLVKAGGEVAETEPVDIEAMAKNAWQTVDTGNGTLRFADPPTIQADRSRLQQLLENLFSNAVSHGGQDVTVTVGAVDGKGFYVADDGTGIPPEDRSRIFEGGFSTRDGGTGFGLRIVSLIADAHGWGVSMTDSEGGGARFEITGTAGV